LVSQSDRVGFKTVLPTIVLSSGFVLVFVKIDLCFEIEKRKNDLQVHLNIESFYNVEFALWFIWLIKRYLVT
jgi:hypothetical protein